MTEELELTILMPCLNEAETIAICIKKAQDYLSRSGVSGEVLIGDNGSTDGSQQIAVDHGARVVSVKEKGYGAALLGGISEAKGKYVIMGDADDSYDFSNLTPFVESLRSGNQLVMGNRFRGGIAPGAMPFLHKYLGNPVLSFIGKLFFNIPCGDFHCGLRGFDRKAIISLDLHTSGMEFASEMVVRAALQKLRIDEVPTTLSPDGRTRPPHLKTWRDGWRHLCFLFMYTPKWLFIYPAVILFALGLSIVGLLYNGPLNIGSVSFENNTFIMGCLFVLISTQSLSLGLLVRRYATEQGFLPNSRYKKWLDKITLEKAALVGLCIFAIGLVLCLWCVLQWFAVGLGDLPSSTVGRQLILGFTLLAIGLQSFQTAFVGGIISVPNSKR
ncbi:glycosyltransferase family 2 protein [Desulfovibrio sp. UCD-KL4C]|uniref:glycosyltransferase family 2 protein n=1 Tax=Desulfovibrio sp. UCD-KL4C TaxID=2578120 RepID=UPI0025BA4D5E|nr:glycosyltransferase family 2 protein [Desulfovibrio sp. UCD-KL4C]